MRVYCKECGNKDTVDGRVFRFNKRIRCKKCGIGILEKYIGKDMSGEEPLTKVKPTEVALINRASLLSYIKSIRDEIRNDIPATESNLPIGIVIGLGIAIRIIEVIELDKLSYITTLQAEEKRGGLLDVRS